MAAEEDSFVSIGTAFEVPEEDAPKKKAVPVHEQVVTDNEGRRRFHGAFTGGFSAGYFNTVGSKEGWKPSTFVSSRSKRFESSHQKPEDFMDEDDLGEFGIAPRNVETTKLFSREHEGKESRTESVASTPLMGSLDSMMKYTLEDLVVPCRMSIGVRLLKKMGWKEGQGIGPRVRQVPKKKVYGCVLPSGPTERSKEDNEHDIYAEGLLFAPKDTTTIKFSPKDNLHGIGYKGMLAPTPMNISKPGFSGNLEIKGQAFGVGAFEDDDEDVYTQDPMSNYDIELHDRKSSHSDLHGWSGPPGQEIKGGALSLFAKASKPKPANKVFSPPVIPKGYQPFVDAKETYSVKKEGKSVTHLTSEARGKLLGEQPLQKPVKSVFDLMSKDDRDRIASAKKTKKPDSPVINTSSQQSSNIRPVGFQPFTKDPAKQARYESFLESRKSGEKSNVPSELRCGLTEWEREREKEEFSRAAMLYQPMKGDIAARFTRGRNIDDDISDKNYCQSKDDAKSVEEKAAEMKMFGKLTRKTFKWHPAKLLCKRFNIPEPYPSSGKTGLVYEKKEKFTLGQLFETSQKVDNELARLGKTTNISENSSSTADEKVNQENMDTDKNMNLGKPAATVGTFEQKVSEKPSMDLFKTIFASSSEDESENSEDEELKIEQSTQINQPVANADVVTKQHTKISHKDNEVTHREDDIYKHDVSQARVQASSNQISNFPGGNTVEEKVKEVEEDDEYGPRPPPLRTPLREESCAKLEFQSRQTVPFSRYDSNSESDSDRPKRKQKKKQKHKSKHKNKNKEKDKDKDKSRKREKDKSRTTNRQAPSDSQKPNNDEQTDKKIPDNKQILSKLKAVQKRRMCAADFM